MGLSMKNIKIKLASPISWKNAEELRLSGVVFITKGGSEDIHALKCSSDALPAVSASLGHAKIAFSCD